MKNYILKFIKQSILLLLYSIVLGLVTAVVLIAINEFFVTPAWVIATIVSCAYASILVVWYKLLVKGLPRI